MTSPQLRANQNKIYRTAGLLHLFGIAAENKPADTVLNSLKAIPPGTPVDEIKHVTDILGLDFMFMKAVAKIKSNFDPKQRTGSYIGLFQLSLREFQKYGSGDIRDPAGQRRRCGLKVHDRDDPVRDVHAQEADFG